MRQVEKDTYKTIVIQVEKQREESGPNRSRCNETIEELESACVAQLELICNDMLFS